MRLHKTAVTIAVAACLATELCADDDQPSSSISIPRTAPRDLLVRAIQNRRIYAGVPIDSPSTGSVITIGDAENRVNYTHYIVRTLRSLDWSIEAKERLSRLSDDDLNREWNRVDPVPPRPDLVFLRDRMATLCEITRRGGALWSERMAEKLDSIDNWHPEVPDDGFRSLDRRNLEELVALRRMERKPDPAHIEASLPELSTFPDLPIAQARLVNNDTRSILVRWPTAPSAEEVDDSCYVEVSDSSGMLAGDLFETDVGKFGGHGSARHSLSPREAAEARISMMRHVPTLSVGTYRVRIHYHDDGADVLAGLYNSITIASDELTLHVGARRVATTRARQEAIQELLPKLPTCAPIQVIVGTYDVWPEKYVSAKSPTADLMRMGWEAVPCLIDLVNNTETNVVQKAWAFGILYSITGICDPTRTDALGSFEMHDNGMRRDAMTRLPIIDQVHRGEIDANEQHRLALEWKRYRGCVVLDEAR